MASLSDFLSVRCGVLSSALLEFLFELSVSAGAYQTNEPILSVLASLTVVGSLPWTACALVV